MGATHTKQFFFRVDSSLRIGSGHVMRCLTLADELRSAGADCFFFCRPRPGDVVELIRKKRYPVFYFQGATDDTYSLGGASEEEVNVIARKVEENRRPGKKPSLVIDHYGIDQSYESTVKPCFESLMVIDDLANRPHDCDILLDQNYSLRTDRYRSLVPEACRQLLGPEYAMLRPEFRYNRRKLELNGRNRFDPEKVMVFFGGTDPDNYTGRTLMRLKEIGHFSPEVVVGMFHPALDDLKKLISSMPGARLHIQTHRMAQIMLGCSWYLGAGGTITWERMCMGLTGIVNPVAENQIVFSEALEKAGYHVLLREITANDLLDLFASLPEMSNRCMALVDGDGIRRVAGYLL